MRKHFLLLFLMALLPLAGFGADNITILPANLQYYYGDPAIPMEEGNAYSKHDCSRWRASCLFS